MSTEILSLTLIFLSTVVANEVFYTVRPLTQPQNHGNSTECIDNVLGLTLSQFINNSSDYLTDDTTLIFSGGSYSLEAELIVEDVHSFSMFVWPGSSSTAVITCGPNARFEFRNVSAVTVSGLKFVGCFENSVVRVDQFGLKNSAFLGNCMTSIGTVLIIEESDASLEYVVFASVLDGRQSTQQNLLDPHIVNCSEFEGTFQRQI